jgi:hypothetical protein
MPGLRVDPPVSDLSCTLNWRHPDSPEPDALDRVLDAADRELGMAYPRLASFIEAHTLAFRQEEWRALRGSAGTRTPSVGPSAPFYRLTTWMRETLRPEIP